MLWEEDLLLFDEEGDVSEVPGCDDTNVEIDEVKVCASDDPVSDDRGRSVVIVTNVVLKTGGGVTQIVSTKVVGWKGCAHDEAEAAEKVVSNTGGGELDDTASRIVVVESAVTVTVCATTWLSEVVLLDTLPREGAGVAVSVA